MMDTIFDHEMRPVFSNEPNEVLRRLKAKHPETWKFVCIGEAGSIVEIPEYLYKDKYVDVQELLKRLLEMKDLAMYKRDPSRLDIQVQKMAKQIIERVLKED